MQMIAQVSVSGTIVDKKTNKPLPYVQIVVKGTTKGTASDANGNYVLKDIPLKSFTLEVSQLGYATTSKHVSRANGANQHLDIYMDEEIFQLDGVVVTSNRSETLRRIAPTLVTVLSPELFHKTSSATLSQGLRFLPGLRIEDNCQNCGFNQVRINGLQGAYSQILIDGRPIFSALSGVYGLEQIPSNMIDRVEVIRGGGSALYGSGAVGGVVNVITREPNSNSVEIAHQMTDFVAKGAGSKVQNTTTFNASVLTEDRNAAIMVFGQHNYRPGYDYDGDSFTEIPNLRNRSLGFRSYLKTGLYGKLTLEYHSMQEYRRGGDRLDLPPFEAHIAEYLQHYINGGELRFDQGFREGKTRFSVYASAQHVQRRSFYGGGDLVDNLIDPIVDTENKADREKAAEEAKKAIESYGTTTDLTSQFGTMINHQFGDSNWFLTAGLENTNDKLNDKSAYRPSDIAQTTVVVGQFDQIEFKSDKLSAVIGGRLDYTNLYQQGKKQIDPLLIFSPRANIRYSPVKDFALRLAYSEGFRAPQFFDEEMHVELLGGEPISRVLSPDLKEERSRSISGSVDHYGFIGHGWQYNIMLQGFCTFISNKFESVPDPTDSNMRIVKNQRDGITKVYGASFEGRLAYKKLFDIQLGLTLQKSRYGENHILIESDEEIGQPEVSTRSFDRTPNVYGYFVSTINPTKHLYFNLSATYTGSMNVLHNSYTGVSLNSDGQAVLDNGDIVHNAHVSKDGSFDFTYDGLRYRGLAQGYGRLVKTKPSFDLDFKVGYRFQIASLIEMELNAGIQNIFDQYQKDTDMGPGRASDYIYGPMLPRRVTCGVKLSF